MFSLKIGLTLAGSCGPHNSASGPNQTFLKKKCMVVYIPSFEPVISQSPQKLLHMKKGGILASFRPGLASQKFIVGTAHGANGLGGQSAGQTCFLSVAVKKIPLILPSVELYIGMMGTKFSAV